MFKAAQETGHALRNGPLWEVLGKIFECPFEISLGPGFLDKADGRVGLNRITLGPRAPSRERLRLQGALFWRPAVLGWRPWRPSLILKILKPQASVIGENHIVGGGWRHPETSWDQDTTKKPGMAEEPRPVNTSLECFFQGSHPNICLPGSNQILEPNEEGIWGGGIVAFGLERFRCSHVKITHSITLPLLVLKWTASY